jgi:hypothetical protein
VARISTYHLGTAAITQHDEDFMPNGRTVLGFYSPARALMIYAHTGDGGGIGYVDFGMDAAAAPRTIYYQHISPNFDIKEVTLSPDRTHLAWKFGVKPLPFGLQSTADTSYVRQLSPSSVEIWISSLNCGNLHEIGSLNIRDDSPNTLHWMPDSKGLSFIYNSTLYTVPIS